VLLSGLSISIHLQTPQRSRGVRIKETTNRKEQMPEKEIKVQMPWADQEARNKKQTELDEMMKKFLANGGVIEKIPFGVTSEDIKKKRALKAKRKKGA